ncbi:hypothetical protein CLIB1444_02S11012 [[Candida] jaroonii]|uniref:Uncharacterized protein n=1 Tax=[Candida] jaroonii TaxID=467808 RepID=A0ACA9Y410_9ASCO|nr:hypothetical protein CLIB1444_02S11012 [[Candida] jaroonii]
MQDMGYKKGQNDSCALFTSLGMFIIDDNIYPKSWNRPSELNVIGGGGSYSIVGARIIGGERYGKQITGIIDKGSDFPEEVEAEINNWDTGVKFRLDNSRLTTRGCNRYDENNVRHFTYLNPKKRIELDDLLQEDLINSKCFHLICSFDRCNELVDGIKQYNAQAKIIYEPLPDDCIFENFEKMITVLPKIDIFTPNLNEGSQLLNNSEPTTIEGIKEITGKYVKLGCQRIILRCGPLGCYIGSPQMSKHLPAYHQDQKNVIDVTGGGNSFCGGFMIGFYLTNDLVIAGILGNIASGCIIEKLAMPTKIGNIWNGKSVEERLDWYLNHYHVEIERNKIDWL